MVILLYVLPVLLLICVIIAVFIDINAAKGKILMIAVIVFALIVVIGSEIGIHQESRSKTQIEQETASVQAWKTGQISRLVSILAGLTETTRNEGKKLNGLAHYGWTIQNPAIQEAFSADAARTELKEIIPPPQHPIIIENLPEHLDKMLIAFAFEELGYIVKAPQIQAQFAPQKDESKDSQALADATQANTNTQAMMNEAQVKAPLKTDDDALKYPANILYFGHLVRNNDIKLILYTLKRAGISMHKVKNFQQNTNANARSIQFDYSKIYTKRPALSVATIKNTKLFKR